MVDSHVDLLTRYRVKCRRMSATHSTNAIPAHAPEIMYIALWPIPTTVRLWTPSGIGQPEAVVFPSSSLKMPIAKERILESEPLTRVEVDGNRTSQRLSETACREFRGICTSLCISAHRFDCCKIPASSVMRMASSAMHSTRNTAIMLHQIQVCCMNERPLRPSQVTTATT